MAAASSCRAAGSRGGSSSSLLAGCGGGAHAGRAATPPPPAGTDDARSLPPARRRRRHGRLVHGAPTEGQVRWLLDDETMGEAVSSAGVATRHEAVIAPLAPGRALHLPGVLRAGAPRRGGGDGRLLVPRARARGPPPRGVRGLRASAAPASTPWRRRSARRRSPPDLVDDRGRRHLPAGRRRVATTRASSRRTGRSCRSSRSTPLPGNHDYEVAGGQALLRRLHPAEKRPPRARARVVLLARAGGRADDRPRHEPEHRDAAPAVRALAHRRRPPARDVPPRLPAPHDVLVRAQATRSPRRGRCARCSRPSTPRPVSTSSSTATTTSTSALGRSAASST